jgi:hypothetical protein
VLLDLIDYNNNEHLLVLDMVDMVLDDKVINIYDHIQVLNVFHMFVHMNVELTMDQIEDRFLFDNNINNVWVFLFDQIQFDILD